MALSWKAMILVLPVAMTLLLSPAVSEAIGPPAYRITADRNANSFTLGKNEPLQVNVKKGQTRTFSFNKPVTGVISRNPTVAHLTVASGAIEARGLIPGRTGMRITFEGEATPLFMGLRVDNADGSLPGLPGAVALGSVSEDGEADLAFWEGHVPGPKGTRMDLRYIYLNNGPFNGWHTWWNRVQNFAANSMLWGMAPFFVFYNIPADKGEGYEIDLKNINNFYYMVAYYANLHLFLKQAKEVMQGELYGIVVEPDFLGYMQQSGKQPSEITTFDGTLKDTVTSINQIIAQKKAGGDNIIFGWQLNVWADNATNQKDGTIRRTDDLGWAEGRKVIAQAAEKTANYAISAGALSQGADFLVVDKYGLDGRCIEWGVDARGQPIKTIDASKYFWNNDHWMNYLLFVKTISEISKKKVLLWQLPVGHINSSTAISARTQEQFPDLANVHTKWEDSSTTFFFGDSFDVSGDVLDDRTPSPTRLSYFGQQNQAKDPTLSVSGNRITWGSHINILPENGIIAAMFGAGIGLSTKGTGNPPPDDYFWIQKAQVYYLGLQHKRIAPILQYLLLCY